MTDLISVDFGVELLLLLPALDYVSDVLTLVFAWIYVVDCGIPPLEDPVLVAGTVVFGLSFLVRCVCDFLAGMGSGFANDCDCCCLPAFAIFGPVTIVFRVVKLCLLPLDPILSIGAYADSGEFLFLTRDFMHIANEKNFFDKLPIFSRYYHCLMSLCDGSRWYAMVSEKYEYKSGLGAKDLAILALFEEVLENTGGLLIAIAALGQDDRGVLAIDEGGVLAIVSLCFTAISLLVETGYFITKAMRTQ